VERKRAEEAEAAETASAEADDDAAS